MWKNVSTTYYDKTLKINKQDEMIDSSDIKERLALRKAELEVKSLRSDLILKPFGLLTPLILAVGIYLLIQAPNRDAQDRGQCLREIEFVGKIDSDKNSTALDAMRDFPFSCGSARATFESKINIKSSSASLKDAGAKLSSLDSKSNLEGTSNSDPSKDCKRTVENRREERYKVLNDILDTLLKERNKIIVEQQIALQEARSAAAGLDGSGIAACGKICSSAQKRAIDLKKRSIALVSAISRLRQDIDGVHAEFTKALSICR